MTVLFSEQELAALRTDAEGEMQDTFTAYSPNGTTPDADGYQDPAFASQGSTPGKVQGGSAASADVATEFVTIGGVRRPVMSGGLHLPLTAPVPTGGDQGLAWEYVCTAVGPASDPSLLGRRYRVVSVPAKSFATARRLDVVEL